MDIIYNIKLSGQYYICGRLIPVKTGDQVTVKESGEILINGSLFIRMVKN
jgi:hypothetical protein